MKEVFWHSPDMRNARVGNNSLYELSKVGCRSRLASEKRLTAASLHTYTKTQTPRGIDPPGHSSLNLKNS